MWKPALETPEIEDAKLSSVIIFIGLFHRPGRAVCLDTGKQGTLTKQADTRDPPPCHPHARRAKTAVRGRAGGGARANR